VNRPPAILVGANMVTAISVIRSLASRGVDVRLLCRPDAVPSYSRLARRLPTDGIGPQPEQWLRFLLGPRSGGPRGAVLLACNDDAVELLLDHRSELAAKYVLDVCDPAAQRAMLDKLATYRLAAEAGVPTPRFWPAESPDQIARCRDEFTWPLMLKPLYAHRFKKVLEGKFLMARDFDELMQSYRLVREHDVEVVLLEVIPGPDDLLCSYYTYIDEDGAPLFHFTKRVIRRFPEREGFGCYHITDWNAEVRDLGLRLFQHAGLKGIANVEFKRDPRDGRLKLIECNARFTAANGLLLASGIDLAGFVYCRLAGLEVPVLDDATYARGLRLWYPLDDFLAFLELRRQGRMGLSTWLRSVCHPQTLPFFTLSDPAPSLMRLKGKSRVLAAGGVRRMRERWWTDGA
jgi:D-aspartate ligase